MKKPYLNQYQRQYIYLKTTLGSALLLNIAFKKLFREFDRQIIIPLLNRINSVV